MPKSQESDWTQGEGFDPNAESPEDFMLPGGSTYDQSAEQIEEANRFIPIPPGPQMLVVRRLKSVTEKQMKMVLDGKHRTITASAIIVEFGLADGSRGLITDNFITPPADETQRPFYWKGDELYENGKTMGKPGFYCNKFHQFLGRLIEGVVPGQPYPPDAMDVKRWKGRKVGAIVLPPKPYEKDGVSKEGFASIQLFQYCNSSEFEQFKAAHVARNAGKSAGGGGGGSGQGKNNGAVSGSASGSGNGGAVAPRRQPTAAATAEKDPLDNV